MVAVYTYWTATWVNTLVQLLRRSFPLHASPIALALSHDCSAPIALSSASEYVYTHNKYVPS